MWSLGVLLKKVADTVSPINGAKQQELYEDFYLLKSMLQSYNLLNDRGLPVRGAIPRLIKANPELAPQIRKLNKSKDELILANLRFAIKQAKRYLDYAKVPDSFFDDLVSAGCEGLTHALYKYSPSEGTKFSTYAHFWVIAKIRQSLESVQLIRKTSNDKRPYRYRFYSDVRDGSNEYTDIFESVTAEAPSLLSVIHQALTPGDLEFILMDEPLLQMLACNGDIEAVRRKCESIREKVLEAV